jgi:hypothetical protein
MDSKNGNGTGFFDPNETFGSEFTPLPEGEYPVVLNNWDWKSTRRGDGHYLEMEFIIIEHIMTNRKQWDRLNLDNPNEKAVQISRETLNKFLRACFWAEKIDSEEDLFAAMRKLQGKRLNIVIQHKNRDGQTDVQIRDYKQYQLTSSPGTGTGTGTDEMPF